MEPGSAAYLRVPPKKSSELIRGIRTLRPDCSLTLNNPGKLVVLIEVENLFVCIQRRSAMRRVPLAAKDNIRQVKT